MTNTTGQDTTTQEVNPFKEIRSIEIWWHVLDEPIAGVIGDWVVSFLDEQGGFIGESLCCFTKMYAIEQAKRFATEYDQAIRIFVAKTKSNEHYKIVNVEASAPYNRGVYDSVETLRTRAANRYGETITAAELFNGLYRSR